MATTPLLNKNSAPAPQGSKLRMASDTVEWLLFPIRLVFWPFFLIYRGYFHPLAKFPGPKWAGMTKWYEFYYDVVCKGQFVFKVQELHKQYGPIVRITPDELHIEDSTFYDKLYSDSEPRDKYVWMASRFGAPDALAVTGPHNLHAERRAALAPLFSATSTQNLETLIWSYANDLCDKIRDYAKIGVVVPLQKGWTAYAGDVVSEAMLAHSYGHTKSQDFNGALDEALKAAGETGPMVLQFPLVMTMINALPDSMAAMAEPRIPKLLALKKDLKNRTTAAIEGRSPKTAHSTIFSTLLSSNLPARELTTSRVWQEAQVAIGFGIPAPSWALTVISYHIIHNSTVSKKLSAELATATSNGKINPSATALQKLPYLRACIKEGVRLSYGTSTRQPRIDPHSEIKYKKWTIPAGTPVSMTPVDIHHDESIFPDSHTFKPERWLESEDSEGNSKLDKYMVAFGGGSRRCLGYHLAQAELYIGIAAVFSRFGFELFDTDDSDIKLKHDFFSPMPKLDSKGVRAKVISVE